MSPKRRSSVSLFDAAIIVIFGLFCDFNAKIFHAVLVLYCIVVNVLSLFWSTLITFPLDMRSLVNSLASVFNYQVHIELTDDSDNKNTNCTGEGRHNKQKMFNMGRWTVFCSLITQQNAWITDHFGSNLDPYKSAVRYSTYHIGDWTAQFELVRTKVLPHTCLFLWNVNVVHLTILNIFSTKRICPFRRQALSILIVQCCNSKIYVSL